MTCLNQTPSEKLPVDPERRAQVMAWLKEEFRPVKGIEDPNAAGVFIVPIESNGRSGAKVTHLARFRRVGPKNSSRPVYDSGTYVKDNHDPKINQIESDLYDGLERASLEVPRERVVQGSTIIINGIDGLCLEDKVTEIYESCGDAEASRRLASIFSRVVPIVAKADTLTGKILTDEQKTYLNDKRMQKLVAKFERFGKTEKDIEENFHAYRIMEALDFYDPQFIELFAPMEKKLQEIKAKYKCWIFGAYPRNLIVSKDDKRITLIDGNNPQEETPFVTLSYLLDSYYSMWKGGSLDATTDIFNAEGMGIAITSFYKQLKKQNPEMPLDNFNEFCQNTVFTSPYRCSRQMGHVSKELENTKGISGKYKKLRELRHYLLHVVHPFAALEKELGIQTEVIGKYLAGKVCENVSRTVSEEDFKDMKLFDTDPMSLFDKYQIDPSLI